MNWKLIIVGALVFWVVTNLLGFVSGVLIHENILDPIYQANESFWIPPLREDPPDMAAVMPRWLLTSLLGSLVVAGIYGCVHTSFRGPGWRKGLSWGLCLGILTFSTYLAFSGLFDLPMKLWIWWGIDGLIIYGIGGIALGWAGHRFASS